GSRGGGIMTQRMLSRIWPHVPPAQRRRLIAQLSQMVTRRLDRTAPAEETPHEHDSALTPFGAPQNSRVALRPLGGGLCAPVDTTADDPASGVDALAIRPRRARTGAGLGQAAGVGDW